MKILILSISFTISIALSAQNGYHKLPEFYMADSTPIDSMVSENKRKNKILIYRPSSVNGIYCSILLIKRNEKTNYYCFRNDSLLLQGQLQTDLIFKYKDYKKTGVIKSEAPETKFTPPLSCLTEDNESIVYYDSQLQFYFELGNVLTYYNENLKRTKYRKEWLEIITRELKDILKSEE